MLIERSVTAAGVRLLILENDNECEICHRTRADCDALPWPNHKFSPANCDARRCPLNWLLLPRIPESEAHLHSLGRPRPKTTDHLAPIIPIPNQGTLT